VGPCGREEHKKNVAKWEENLEVIKTATEEAADALKSTLEGRKSLKALRDERVRGPTSRPPPRPK
jgi:hypothetical protein